MEQICCVNVNRATPARPTLQKHPPDISEKYPSNPYVSPEPQINQQIPRISPPYQYVPQYQPQFQPQYPPQFQPQYLPQFQPQYLISQPV